MPAIQLKSIGCSILSCIQSVSSKINYHTRTTMNAGFNAIKPNMKALDSNELVPDIQFTSIGCSMVACIQSISSEINYHIRTTINAGKKAVNINESVGCK